MTSCHYGKKFYESNYPDCKTSAEIVLNCERRLQVVLDPSKKSDPAQGSRQENLTPVQGLESSPKAARAYP